MTAHDDEAERRHEHQPGQRVGCGPVHKTNAQQREEAFEAELEALQEKYWVELYGDYGFQARTCARCNDSVTPGLRLCDPCANNEEA